MTNYRKFLYRAAAVYFLAITPFTWLAQSSLGYAEPSMGEFVQAQLNAYHSKEQRQAAALADLWNIRERDLHSEVNIFGEKL